jgi:hypothetical protein
MEVEGEIGYGVVGGESCFWILTPFNKEPATVGNGVQISFQASSIKHQVTKRSKRSIVLRWH